MSISFDEIMNQFPDGRRNRIIAESERLEVEYLMLQMLHKANKLTQAQLDAAIQFDDLDGSYIVMKLDE